LKPIDFKKSPVAPLGATALLTIGLASWGWGGGSLSLATTTRHAAAAPAVETKKHKNDATPKRSPQKPRKAAVRGAGEAFSATAKEKKTETSLKNENPAADQGRTPYAEIDAFYRRRNEREYALKGLQLARQLLARSLGAPGAAGGGRTAVESPAPSSSAMPAVLPDAEAAWRVGLGCYVLAHKHSSPGSEEDQREALFREGMEASQAGLKSDPRCAPCHFWAGVNMALYGQTVGAFKMFRLVDSIRSHAEASAKLDPTYASGGAYRLLGQLEEGLPGLLGGSNARAQEWFEKAVAAVPDDPMNYAHLVRILRKRDRDDEAVLAAKKALALPAPQADQHEALGALEELRNFILENSSKQN
jgi:hypothetical protein